MDKWFRLDALLLDNQADDGEGPHEELYQMLKLHPAIATFGITSTTDGARRYMAKRIVNTIFVNIRPVLHAAYWEEVNEFLLHMYKIAPNVLIIFYANKKEHNSFLKQYPFFAKYYFIEAGWISPNEPNKIPITQEHYQKFNNWHMRRYLHDVCISYASENAAVAELLKTRLCDRNRVFYGEHERGELWGKELAGNLALIFETDSRSCIVFLSEAYLQKLYTKLELEAALKRIKGPYKSEYLLIVNLDKSQDSLIPKTLSFLKYITEEDLNTITDFLNKKLWRGNTNLEFIYFGRDADRSYDRLEDFVS